MENTCKKCGNNLYGNRIKCAFCGEPIGQRSIDKVSTSRNTYSYATKPRQKQKKPSFGLLEISVLLLVSFFVPPFGIIFFFGFNKEQSKFAMLALVAGIFGFMTYIS